MTPIGPGTMLICIRADVIDDDVALQDLQVGRQYECSFVDVSTLDECAHRGTQTLIQLVEMPGHPDVGYWACQFTPAGRKGDFEPLLKVEPIHEREDA